ncbi:MAG: hypothetical protein KGQ93_14000 [Cyanobacteria bacterium REEB459]|nr:hypothetical protein [Cyanobacteria bacterium REEB459]
MATDVQVRDFLAHWFQLGKPVVLPGGRGDYLPRPVFCQGSYSQDFENCWNQIMATQGQDCYLKGTVQTIAAMLSPAWDVQDCARCAMPVSIPTLGLTSFPCPCHDLLSWPNQDIPVPRGAVNDQRHLEQVRERLSRIQGQSMAAPQGTYKTEGRAVFSSWRKML